MLPHAPVLVAPPAVRRGLAHALSCHHLRCVNTMPEPSPEIRRSQVTLKTVFTICGGILIVAAAVLAAWKAIVAIGLTLAAALLAVALDHLIRKLTRRGWPRGWAIAAVMSGVIGLLVGFGFLLIPPAL